MKTVYAVHVRSLALSVSMGIYDAERATPQEVVISACIFLEQKDSIRDSIDEVQDYDFIRNTAQDLVRRGHFDLQETFCMALLDRCMAEPRVLGAVVRTEKSTVYPDAKGVGCTMSKRKPGVEIPDWLVCL
jgi:7,8-dihydroneopterin aldolase/epimerase/oxygenase